MQITFASLLELIRTVANLPHAELLFERSRDPESADRIYKHFTMRHPRYFVCRNKTIGTALVNLRHYANPPAYLATVTGRNSADKHARRARSRGYIVREINRNDHIDDIHHINTSVDVRQGQAMAASYMVKQSHYDQPPNYKVYGIIAPTGNLVAYAELAFWGNFAAFNRIIGVRNNDGIMHLLVTHIICELIEDSHYQYLMYDTYFGASPGLKAFKTTLGFVAHHARYSIQ